MARTAFIRKEKFTVCSLSSLPLGKRLLHRNRIKSLAPETEGGTLRVDPGRSFRQDRSIRTAKFREGRPAQADNAAREKRQQSTP